MSPYYYRATDPGRVAAEAAHLVAPAQAFWTQLAELRELGASGIVALRPDALLPS